MAYQNVAFFLQIGADPVDPVSIDRPIILTEAYQQWYSNFSRTFQIKPHPRLKLEFWGERLQNGAA
jgi:hypothetical protein